MAVARLADGLVFAAWFCLVLPVVLTAGIFFGLCDVWKLLRGEDTNRCFWKKWSKHRGVAPYTPHW